MTQKVLLNNGSVLKKDDKSLPIITEGLVAYYPFEETGGGTAYDESKNGNDGTLRGGDTRR